MDKLELLKAITDFHPAAEAGRKRGWNWYIGGMKDSGDWYFRKLLDAPIEELEKCLEELKIEFAPKPKPVYSEQDIIDMNTPVITFNGVSTVYEQNKWKEFFKKQEEFILWGKRV